MVAISFVSALRDKYMLQEDVSSNLLVLPKDRAISTDITLVGFKDVLNIQSQLARLTSIDLSHRKISHSGQVLDVAYKLKSVVTLNLSNNQLSWRDIAEITQHLPQLRDLIVTENNLSSGFDYFSNVTSKNSLSCLTLGRTHIDWFTLVTTLSKIWSHVYQIDLWDSGLSPINMKLQNDSLCSFVSNLVALKMSENTFADIGWLEQIGPLDNLKELDLSRCQLEYIELNQNLVHQLRNLATLNVSYNSLNDWRSISELNKLPLLNHLLCQGNPLFILEKLARTLTIARLARLKLLNKEELSNTIRRDSEIFYLRKVYPEYESYLRGENSDFKSIHPRYEEIADHYGLPEDLTQKKVVNKYIDLDLCYGERKITKKLPCDMRVSNVLMLCKRLFCLRPSRAIELICIDPNAKDSSLHYKIDKEGQTLNFFSVKNGDKLLIREVDKE